jgi:hypothetical protein
MTLIKTSFILVFLSACQTQPIKGIPRPKVPICLINVDDNSKAICGYGKDEEEFEINSREIIGSTAQGYQDAERYINLLENKIRTYQRRCRK